VKTTQVGIVLALLITVALSGLVLRVLADASSPSKLSGLFPISEGVIDQVLIEAGGESARIIKSGDSDWRIGIHEAFPMRLAGLWSVSERLRQAQLVAERKIHHFRLGVDDANSVRVKFFKGQSIVEEVLIGRWSDQAGLSYLRKPSNDTVFSVPFNLRSIFDASPKAWRNPIVLDLDPEQITQITFMYPDQRVALERQLSDASAWYVVTPEGRKPAVTSYVQQVIDHLTPLFSTDFPSDSEARALSFSEPDFAIEIISTGETPFKVLSLLKRDETSYYVKLADDDTIFILNQAQSEALLKKADDFLAAES
jgi:hypothetical protein